MAAAAVNHGHGARPAAAQSVAAPSASAVRPDTAREPSGTPWHGMSVYQMLGTEHRRAGHTAPSAQAGTARPAAGAGPSSAAPVTPSSSAAAVAPPAHPSAAASAAAPAAAAPHVPAPAPAPAPAYQPPPRTQPGAVTVGHYLRSLTGDPAHDVPVMRTLGGRDAFAAMPGHRYLVLLDIGGQVPGGIMLSATTRTISNQAIVNAANAYIAGYHSRQHPNAPVTVALGTSNDLQVSTAYGQSWARDVVNPVRRVAATLPQLSVAGASDIEPGFTGGPRDVQAWLKGFLASTDAPFIFNGSADGCSDSVPNSGCVGGWSAQDLAYLAGAAAPGRIEALPQVYNTTMAAQWAQISRTALLVYRHPLTFAGPLTETAACGGDPQCVTMPSAAAWAWLWRSLFLAGPPVRQSSLPVQVDLDVQ